MKTAIVLLLAIVAQTAGGVILTKAMHGVSASGADQTALMLAINAIESPAVWLGTALLIVFFALYAAALSWADLSFVLPATSFGYVLHVVCGQYFLNEKISAARWAGSALIFAGVVLVSRSGVRGVNPSPPSLEESAKDLQ